MSIESGTIQFVDDGFRGVHEKKVLGRGEIERGKGLFIGICG